MSEKEWTTVRGLVGTFGYEFEFSNDGIPTSVYVNDGQGSHYHALFFERVANLLARRRLLRGVGMCDTHGYYRATVTAPTRMDSHAVRYVSPCPTCREADSEDLLKDCPIT